MKITRLTFSTWLLAALFAALTPSADVAASTTRPLRPITKRTTPLAQPGAALTFVVAGDGRPPLPRMPLPRVAAEIMREVALLSPAFVLYSGDIMYGYGDTRQEMLNEFDRFRALADTTGVPLYNVPGNHDMQSSAAAVSVLKERGQDMYGSFDVGRYHFVGLNTDEVNLEQRVTGEQFEWLKADLEANKGAAGVFVFMHRPLYSEYRGDFNPDDAAALHALFRRYPVKAVFAGHDHLYREEVRDGVRYVTAGGGGAPIYVQPQAGGFAHYLVVTAAPDKVEITVAEPGHIEVVYTAGNDGIEPITVARLMNSSDRDFPARNLRFRVPRLSDPKLYRVTTDLRDYSDSYAGKPVALAAAVRGVEDNGDGSVTLSVEVALPAGTGFYVTVEAREPPSERKTAATRP